MLDIFVPCQSLDHTVQKKAYRVLEGLCDCSTETGRQFAASHLQVLQETLVTSLSSSSPSSKGVSAASQKRFPRKFRVACVSILAGLFSKVLLR